jgi:hypothetical protein
MNSISNAGQDYEGLVKGMNAVDDQALQQDSATRAKVLASARRLCQRLESPWERIARMFWGEVRLCHRFITERAMLTGLIAVDHSLGPNRKPHGTFRKAS